MVNSVTRNIKIVLNWLSLIVAFIIVSAAIAILLGRQSIDELDKLRPEIQSFIASSTGMQVNLGELNGQWPRLVPALDVESFEMIGSDDEPVLGVQKGRAYLDVVNSIKHLAPIWRELVIEDLVVSFVEDAAGRWNLKGFTGQSGSDLDIILKPFIYSRHIRLKSVAINLQSLSGKTTHIFGRDMLIENDADFHRAQLSVSFAKDDIPAYLVLEAQGDPRDLDSFYADGYLKFDKLNLSEQLLGYTKFLMPELFENLSKSQLEAGGEIWVDIHPGGGFDFEGQLAVSSLPLNWLADVPPITDMTTEITGWYTPGLNWGVHLKDFTFDWSNISLDPHSMMFTRPIDSQALEFDLAISHLNLTLLSRILLESQVSKPNILDFIDTAGLGGGLSSLSLTRRESGYSVSANLDSFHMHPYKGAPGMKDINGYLELNKSGGIFHIADNDGFSLFFPKQYRDYQKFDSAEGDVYLNWQPSKNLLLVRSNAVSTQSPAGKGNVMFSVEQPWPNEGQPPEVNVLISGRDLDASYGSDLLPYKTPETLSKWLKTSIKSGNVKEFAMLFRSGPPKNNKVSRTTQLMFNTQKTKVKYHPDWPPLDDMEALIMVDDGTVDSHISLAKMGQTTITQATLEYAPSASIDQRRIIVDASVSGGVAEAIDVLANSPLREKIGPLAQWHYGGQSHSEMHLEIPLTAGQKPNSIGANYRINSVINNAQLSIANSQVELKDLSATLEVSTENGLYSNNLSATLWQKPFNATFFKADGQQKMALKTVLSPASLNKFVDFSWDEIVSGDLPIDGVLDIDLLEKTSRLKLKSPMQGVALNLPEPFGKPAEELQALEITLSFDPNFSRLQGNLGDRLQADLIFAEDRFQRGLVSYDRSPLSPEEGQLLVAIHLPTVEFDVWTPLLSKIQSSQKSKKTHWEPIFDLEFDYLTVAGLDLQAISAKVRALQTGLNVAFTSNLADGQITMPWDKEQVLVVDLNTLQMPAFNSQQSPPLGEIDPREFIPLDFAVTDFGIEKQTFGSLSFELRPEPSGAAFSNISGDLLGMRPGVYETEAPTDFFWGYDGERHLSKIVGPVGVKNITDLLNGFAIPKFLDSESGKLDLNLSWQAQPWALSKETIQGDLRVSLEEGSFYRSTGGAEATLKIISLFNFANWLRRLQLDFSDVVGKNLAYNKLDAYLSFNQGILSFNEPLKIDMPSGKMSMGGEFDLINEAVDAKLVATLPVGVNLPWLVGLAGGLPAAAGVYITSKLAQKQVDRLSSISYTLKGPWDDIEVSVDEIFAAELSE